MLFNVDEEIYFSVVFHRAETDRMTCDYHPELVPKCIAAITRTRLLYRSMTESTHTLTQRYSSVSVLATRVEYGMTNVFFFFFILIFSMLDDSTDITLIDIHSAYGTSRVALRKRAKHHCRPHECCVVECNIDPRGYLRSLRAHTKFVTVNFLSFTHQILFI